MERAEDLLHRLCDEFLALADRLVAEADLGADLEDAVRAFGKDLADVHHEARASAAFLVSLAHDLRAPIGALMHQTQLLTADALPDDLKARSLSALEDNAAELEELLGTLADLERPMSGSSEPDPVDDPLLGRVGMIADIDERKRAEERILALASNLALAEYEERRRIARVLHDDLQQRLYSLRMKVGMLRREPGGEHDGPLAEIEQQLTESVDLTRALTVDLSPPILEGEGLADALAWLATQMGEMHGLRVDVQTGESFPMKDEDMRVFLFQIVRELLFNVVKHAGVDRATVSLEHRDGRLRIAVADHGDGFVPDTFVRSGGLGLSNVAERLALFGGRMHIASEPGGGTTVELTIPHPARTP